MKVESQGEVVEFKPVVIKITLESQEELDAFYRAGDTVYREHPSGSEEEKLGMQMKQSVDRWYR